MTVTINGTTGIDKVQDGVVTSASIADGAVTPTDLSTGKPNWDSSGNLQFNSGYGSVATAYGCRAWVNFNGTGTVAIRASGNVSSITDNGVGQYTINFTTAMPDADYAATVNVGGLSTQAWANAVDATTPRTTSAIRIRVADNTSALRDDPVVNVAIFR